MISMQSKIQVIHQNGERNARRDREGALSISAEELCRVIPGTRKTPHCSRSRYDSLLQDWNLLTPREGFHQSEARGFSIRN